MENESLSEKKKTFERYEFEEPIVNYYYEEDVKEHLKNIINWCYQNNTIPMKNNINLARTDGGWVNVLELIKKIKQEFGEELI